MNEHLVKINTNFFNSNTLVNTIIVLFSTLFILMYVISFIESNISIVMSTFLLTFVSILFILLISNKEMLKGMLAINALFILFYMLHMLVQYYSMINYNNEWYLYFDEKRYFVNSITHVSRLIDEGTNLFDLLGIYEYKDTALYLYIQAYLLYFANYYDAVSILTQKQFNVYVSALIPTVLFYILAKFIGRKEAFYAAVIYGIFSFNLTYSSPLLRDGFGAFLYIFVFYYYLLPTSNKNLIMMVFFAFLSYTLRPETGMYAFLISSTYIYFQYSSVFKNKALLKTLALFILLPLIILVIYRYNIIGVMNSLMDRSVEHSISSTSGGSLGAALLKLPIFIKLPLKFIHSQILSFPPWSILYDSRLDKVVFFRFSEFIASISWLHVWPFILIGIFKDKLFRKMENEKLYFLFILSILYIALSGIISSIPRKLMYVYPILFVVATVSYVNMDKNRRNKIMRWSMLGYILLIGLYLSVKYLR